MTTHYSRVKLKHFTRYWNCKWSHNRNRYRRRNVCGYELKFEVWGKANRRWVGLPDNVDCGTTMGMYGKKCEPFEDLYNRLKEPILLAVELEKQLNDFWI